MLCVSCEREKEEKSNSGFLCPLGCLSPHARAPFQLPAPARRRHSRPFRAPPQILIRPAPTPTRASAQQSVLQRGDRRQHAHRTKACMDHCQQLAAAAAIYKYGVQQMYTRGSRRKSSAGRSLWPTTAGHALEIDSPAERGNLSIRWNKLYRTNDCYRTYAFMLLLAAPAVHTRLVNPAASTSAILSSSFR